MHRRNRNIILFFEENENARSISSKMVRLYMNRFIIDEKERFEITGVFQLAKVPKITYGTHHKRRRLENVSTRNWNEDRELIRDAFKKLEIFTLLSTDIHIFMGTSLYLDLLNNNYSLYELVRNLVQKCSSSTSISMTLLNGQNHELHTRNHVQNVYTKNLVPIFYKYRRQKWRFHSENDHRREFFNLRFLFKFPESRSLNDDLETFYAAVARNEIFRQSRVRNLFLFELQSEEDIETKPDLIRRSDDHQYLLSLCKVITVIFVPLLNMTHAAPSFPFFPLWQQTQHHRERRSGCHV